jgi:hypothetical membrane protein
MSARQLGTLALVGIGYFVAALVALHFLEPDFSIVDEYTSDYALGESFGWVMRTVFIGAAVGTISIALGLRATLAPGKRVKASWLLMFVAGIGFIVVATFNGDATGVEDLTTSGTVHLAAAAILFLSLLICVWFLRGVFKRDDGWQHLTKSQLAFAIAYTIMFVVSFGLSEGGPVGLTQRIFVAVVMAWLAFLAWQVREHAEVA